MDKNEDIKAQIKRLDNALCGDPGNADLYFERGKLLWKIGNRGGAITDFNMAVGLDPASGAQAYLEMANSIMDFYNTDLYNP